MKDIWYMHGESVGDGPALAGADAGSPDVGFTLAGFAHDAVPEVPQPREDLTARLGAELRALLAPGWARLDAAFSFTVSDEAAEIVLSNEQGAARVRPSGAVIALLREHRHRSAQSEEGPWWRFLVALSAGGDMQVEYDYGVEPFPGDHLFPAAAYQADLRTYPRTRLPVWLAAYVGHDGCQVRTPGNAAVRARAEYSKGVQAVPAGSGLPTLSLMWARWAVISAAFEAVDSPWGPRISAALGWFEGASRSGSTLHRLPNGRAVLSGGVWNAPALDAAYNDDAPMPRLYRGAPEWVADPVLNPRAANGLLSFCYWWDGTAWYRGESPATEELATAIPRVWTGDSTVDLIAGLIDNSSRASIAALVSAAESGTVTRAVLAEAFGDDSSVIDAAYYQLILAGVVKA